MSPLSLVSAAVVVAGLAFVAIGMVHLMIGRHMPWFTAAAACFAVGLYGLASA